MKLIFSCPHCKNNIDVDSEISGDRAECPSCHEIVLIPAPGIEIGMEIGGFRIERRLGVGGMGEVFEATQLAMNRRVALKVLPPGVASYPARLSRFIHEVEMAAKLEHPNIVTAFYAGSGKGYYYLAMSYVDGVSLEEKLNGGLLKEKEALEICLKVAKALHYSWSKFNMLHRDIKPANIMIDVEDEVKLMDLGIAKTITEDSSLTSHGALVGTPFYMSPEQALANIEIDCRADIYSLGATFYHMVTGTKPFDGPNAMAVIAKHLSEPPEAPLNRNPHLSEPCNDLIMKMMARDRDQRPENWLVLQQSMVAVLERRVNPHKPVRGAPSIMLGTAAPPEEEASPPDVEMVGAEGAGGDPKTRYTRSIEVTPNLATVKFKKPPPESIGELPASLKPLPQPTPPVAPAEKPPPKPAIAVEKLPSATPDSAKKPTSPPAKAPPIGDPELTPKPGSVQQSAFPAGWAAPSNPPAKPAAPITEPPRELPQPPASKPAQPAAAVPAQPPAAVPAKPAQPAAAAPASSAEEAVKPSTHPMAKTPPGMTPDGRPVTLRLARKNWRPGMKKPPSSKTAAVRAVVEHAPTSPPSVPRPIAPQGNPLAPPTAGPAKAKPASPARAAPARPAAAASPPAAAPARPAAAVPPRAAPARAAAKPNNAGKHETRSVKAVPLKPQAGRARKKRQRRNSKLQAAFVVVLVACISIFFLTLFGFFIVEIRSNDSSDGDKGMDMIDMLFTGEDEEINAYYSGGEKPPPRPKPAKESPAPDPENKASQATLKHQLVSQQLKIALMYKENFSGAEGQEKIRTALLKALEHADTEKDRELIRTRAAEYKINLGTAKP